MVYVTSVRSGGSPLFFPRSVVLLVSSSSWTRRTQSVSSRETPSSEDWWELEYWMKPGWGELAYESGVGGERGQKGTQQSGQAQRRSCRRLQVGCMRMKVVKWVRNQETRFIDNRRILEDIKLGMGMVSTIPTPTHHHLDLGLTSTRSLSLIRLDYVLALKIEDFLERRLQTQVFKSGLAKSIHHARVLIRQRHIRYVSWLSSHSESIFWFLQFRVPNSSRSRSSISGNDGHWPVRNLTHPPSP